MFVRISDEKIVNLNFISGVNFLEEENVEVVYEDDTSCNVQKKYINKLMTAVAMCGLPNITNHMNRFEFANMLLRKEDE